MMEIIRPIIILCLMPNNSANLGAMSNPNIVGSSVDILNIAMILALSKM